MGTEIKLFSSASKSAFRIPHADFSHPSQTEGITHYTLRCKVVCQQGRCPFWIPPSFPVLGYKTDHAAFTSSSRKCKKYCPHLQRECRQYFLFSISMYCFCKYLVSVSLWCNIFNCGILPFPILKLLYR